MPGNVWINKKKHGFWGVLYSVPMESNSSAALWKKVCVRICGDMGPRIWRPRDFEAVKVQQENTSVRLLRNVKHSLRVRLCEAYFFSCSVPRRGEYGHGAIFQVAQSCLDLLNVASLFRGSRYLWSDRSIRTAKKKAINISSENFRFVSSQPKRQTDPWLWLR